jgi:hypothetical protein
VARLAFFGMLSHMAEVWVAVLVGSQNRPFQFWPVLAPVLGFF